MSDSKENRSEPGEGGAPPRPALLDLEIRPYRSLSPRGFVIFMAAISVVSFGAGWAFFLLGAWPVVGFLGLDVALVYLAFRINYRAARRWERLRLTADSLLVARGDEAGEQSRETLQPYWLTLRLAGPQDQPRALLLRSHGRDCEIGRFLGPAERLALAERLRRALASLQANPIR
ncbi:MAG: DUF2244 domain-containing protein [Kiloniellales bacterium]